MSRFIKAKSIYVTTADAQIVNHDGVTISNNADCPMGTVLCEDLDGEWYMVSHGYRELLGSQHSSKEWPSKKNGYIQLFREYWTILTLDMSPYGQSFATVPKRRIKH